MTFEPHHVYHQTFANGEKVWFRAVTLQKNGRWKGLKTERYFHGKAVNCSADAQLVGWCETPLDQIPVSLRD